MLTRLCHFGSHVNQLPSTGTPPVALFYKTALIRSPRDHCYVHSPPVTNRWVEFSVSLLNSTHCVAAASGLILYGIVGGKHPAPLL